MKKIYTKEQLLNSLKIEKETNKELKRLYKLKGFKNLKHPIKVSDNQLRITKKLLKDKEFV